MGNPRPGSLKRHRELFGKPFSISPVTYSCIAYALTGTVTTIALETIATMLGNVLWSLQLAVKVCRGYNIHEVYIYTYIYIHFEHIYSGGNERSFNDSNEVIIVT